MQSIQSFPQKKNGERKHRLHTLYNTLAKKQQAGIVFRQPRADDGPHLGRLVQQCGSLDTNSTYTYLLLCHHFPDTCAVADVNGNLIGFVTGYLPPKSTKTLFVWQIGVIESMRGHNIAMRLLVELLLRDVCQNISQLEATIGPSNHASRSLFKALARELTAGFSEHLCFDEELFLPEHHESECLVRIGPLPG